MFPEEAQEYILGFQTLHLPPYLGEVSTHDEKMLLICHAVHFKAHMECSLMRDLALIHHLRDCMSLFPVTSHLPVVFREV